ncbi:hypothetical protein FOA43_000399 [Brettanomyces nanus]|uniref:Uncharacterized protein n=1 Tax=Eeniella nana TaxID=13502 RepID=A0A875S0Y1_EENNA|nr:uncharacterized protein FOA43_000399 [Brettanomyces nanus]QPG73094.1 hypothetical protein FOA43_000399 [Brettanomyces nanus]
MPSARFYYIDGKISTCRRCKRKRTLDEPPEHLQFKTCYRCRMIERDQKKVNQARRRGSSSRLDSPSLSHSHHAHRDIASSYYTRGGPTATSHAPAVFNPIGAANSVGDVGVVNRNTSSSLLTNGLNVPDVSTMNSDNLININLANSFARGNSAYVSKGNGAGIVTLDGASISAAAAAAAAVPSTFNALNVIPLGNAGDGSVAHGRVSSLTPSIFNEGLYSFNIRSIDSKSNPLSLPQEQQTLIQLSFLTKLHYDQRYTNSLQYSALGLRADQCVNCSRNIATPNGGRQLCDGCLSRPSIVHIFNYYLTVLKLNKRQDLYKVIFVTRISVDNLLKSSLSADRSRSNIINKLYDRFIDPINNVTGAEFIFMKDDIDHETNGNSEKSSNHARIFPVIKRFLKCAKDHSSLTTVKEENIDPEALKLEGFKENIYVQSSKLTHRGCNSLIFLDYDMRNGDLMICFSHQVHQ